MLRKYIFIWNLVLALYRYEMFCTLYLELFLESVAYFCWSSRKSAHCSWHPTLSKITMPRIPLGTWHKIRFKTAGDDINNLISKTMAS